MLKHNEPLDITKYMPYVILFFIGSSILGAAGMVLIAKVLGWLSIL